MFDIRMNVSAFIHTFVFDVVSHNKILVNNIRTKVHIYIA